MRNDLPSEIYEQLDEVLKSIRKTLAEDGKLSPTAVIDGKDNKTAVVSLNVYTKEDIERSASVLRKLAEDIDAEVIIISSAAFDVPDHLKLHYQEMLGQSAIAPAEIPGCTEVVWILLESYKGIYIAKAEVIRKARAVKLGPLRVEPWTEGSDEVPENFLHMLPVRKSC